jgi:hypothetical protein
MTTTNLHTLATATIEMAEGLSRVEKIGGS